MYLCFVYVHIVIRIGFVDWLDKRFVWKEFFLKCVFVYDSLFVLCSKGSCVQLALLYFWFLTQLFQYFLYCWTFYSKPGVADSKPTKLVFWNGFWFDSSDLYSVCMDTCSDYMAVHWISSPTIEVLIAYMQASFNIMCWVLGPFPGVRLCLVCMARDNLSEVVNSEGKPQPVTIHFALQRLGVILL